MNHITTTDLLEHLKWRYATKQFDPTKTIVPEIRNRTCQLRSNIGTGSKRLNYSRGLCGWLSL